MYDFNILQTACPSADDFYLTSCNSAALTATLAGADTVLAAGYPVVMGETGISAYSAATAAPFSAGQLTDLEGWLDDLLTWMDGQNQGYLAWSWNLDTGPLLIADDAGTPSPYYGVTYQAHLQRF
jgi:hypothetical protein